MSRQRAVIPPLRHECMAAECSPAQVRCNDRGYSGLTRLVGPCVASTGLPNRRRCSRAPCQVGCDWYRGLSAAGPNGILSSLGELDLTNRTALVARFVFEFLDAVFKGSNPLVSVIFTVTATQKRPDNEKQCGPKGHRRRAEEK